MIKLFVTGSTGFVGSHIVENFKQKQHAQFCFAGNDVAKTQILNKGCYAISDLTEMPEIDTCIHLAARVHQMKDKSKDQLSDYRKVNVDFALETANAAIAKGVKKFIFISSVKVYGNQAGFYSEDRALRPDDPYGQSKLEAENALIRLFEKQNTSQLVILRFPMVYGPGNKGNILSLLNAAERGIYLPIGNAYKKRSFVYVGNTVSAINKLIEQDVQKRVQIFNVTDGNDISSCELYATISKIMRGKELVFSIPLRGIQFLAAMSSQFRALESRLFDEYCFDSKKIQNVLNWSPPYSFYDGIRETINWYQGTKGGQ